MIRLFIALDLPEIIKYQIQGLGGSLPKAKIVSQEQLHLTLKFIGEVESSQVLDIEETLEGIELSEFQIRLKGVGVFPPRGSARVLWVGVEEDGALTRLRNKIESDLARIGLPRSKQKFKPHITVARIQKSPTARIQQVIAANSLLETPRFLVEGFSLYSSQLTPKGAIHSCRRSYLPQR